MCKSRFVTLLALVVVGVGVISGFAFATTPDNSPAEVSSDIPLFWLYDEPGQPGLLSMGLGGIPAKLKDLTDLGLILRGKDLTSTQKTEVLLFWLHEERREPSPLSKGLGGGDINSGYVQAQIIKSLQEVGDPHALLEIDADEKADPDIRDAARLALGLMGDSKQIPNLINILEKQREPYFRVTAAEALGSLGAIEAVPALQQALKDEYVVVASNCLSTNEPSTAYPVREAAQTALRVLSMPEKELKELVKAKIERFERRMKPLREEVLPSPPCPHPRPL